ncbi:hypothetical protein GCM10010259_61760 [Streptomyces daghestanicus]|uniref:Transposase n=1 Tax=Streptomyces daghestanicus TaxID=66885 RepID=A0ABQ3Q7S0_9ACTN|nr:hypothetical protein GCM10010259_61760 [Streptomyces daghestanicus]GHI33330.1 hypothetical protein Sdagh_50600 [Streptomyces daghestanicus]
MPVDDRVALRGIVFVLRTGVTWADVPTETIGCFEGFGGSRPRTGKAVDHLFGRTVGSVV